MKPIAFHRLPAMAAIAMVVACAADSARLAPTGPTFNTVQLGDCPELAASGKLTFHAYAAGVQIYRWSGTAWVFVAPRATLYANAERNGVVGSHYAGPTWESVSGSTVVGAVDKRCTPNASAIPWLLLDAVSSSGPGVFDRLTKIQRLNTVGGVAPSTAGSIVGEIAEVPYTAEYFFYRGQ